MNSVIILFTLVASVSAANLWEPCTSQDECSVKNSQCDTVSPSCNSMTCVCGPAFVDIDATTCKPARLLGEGCTANDKCLGENVMCTDGKCECDVGYAKGPRGTCVSAQSKARFGEQCFDSLQCTGESMVCLQNECRCYPGYKNDENIDCAKNSVGDSCKAPEECGTVPNAECSSEGVCSCKSGASRAKVGPGRTAVCLTSSESPAGPGESCDPERPLCVGGLKCGKCSATGYVCQSIPALSAGQEFLMATVSLLMAAAAL